MGARYSFPMNTTNATIEAATQQNWNNAAAALATATATLEASEISVYTMRHFREVFTPLMEELDALHPACKWIWKGWKNSRGDSSYLRAKRSQCISFSRD